MQQPSSSGPNQPQGPTAPPQQSPTQSQGPTTGSFESFKEAMRGFFSFFQGSGPKGKKREPLHVVPPQQEQSAIEKMRDKLADFDEDYKDIGERLLGAFVQLVGYVGPFMLVIWIGSDLGK